MAGRAAGTGRDGVSKRARRTRSLGGAAETKEDG